MLHSLHSFISAPELQSCSGLGGVEDKISASEKRPYFLAGCGIPVYSEKDDGWEDETHDSTAK